MTDILQNKIKWFMKTRIFNENGVYTILLWSTAIFYMRVLWVGKIKIIGVRTVWWKKGTTKFYNYFFFFISHLYKQQLPFYKMDSYKWKNVHTVIIEKVQHFIRYIQEKYLNYVFKQYFFI